MTAEVHGRTLDPAETRLRLLRRPTPVDLPSDYRCGNQAVLPRPSRPGTLPPTPGYDDGGLEGSDSSRSPL